MSKEEKLNKQVGAQEKEIQALRIRVSQLSDQVLLVESEIKGFKQNVTRDLSGLVARVEVLKERVLSKR